MQPLQSNFDLCALTLRALRARTKTITYEQINKETKLSVAWLKAYANGSIKEPSVVKVQKLFNYFQTKKRVRVKNAQ